MSRLEDVLQQCTVKLSLFDRGGWGTGFFVAPGLILTCAHVVQEAKGKSVQIRWQKQENWAQAVVERSLPAPYDLALLRVTTLLVIPDPPCVYLDKEIRSRDPLYLFGYPDDGDCEGEPRTFSCDGITGSTVPAILFNLGQVRPGMSGSPLLNQRTGKVCGIVKFTRDRSLDLGGGAVPTGVILAQFPELVEQQQSFHQRDQRWNTLVTERSDNEAMSQTNLGGANYHSDDSSQVKKLVKKILMLCANPVTPYRTKEIKEIRKALRRAKDGNSFAIEDRPDIGATDLSQELSTIEPWIVDISGDKNGIESLVLENNIGRNTSQNSDEFSEIIADFFKLYASNIECLILNGCCLEKQSKEIAQNIQFVIGIDRSLGDIKISDFLDEFYYQIGSGRTVRDSYNLGFSLLKRKYSYDNQTLLILLEKNNETRRRKLEEELSFYDREIETNQESSILWKKKASLLKELDRLEEANEAYERASSLDPSNYKIRTEQGDTLEQFGKHEEAVNAYNKALELENQDYKVWWKKGQALVEGEEYSEAVISYGKALELDPPSPDNYVICREYGSTLKKLGRYSESIGLHKKSLEFEPRYRASNYEKRQIYKKIYSGKDDL